MNKIIAGLLAAVIVLPVILTSMVSAETADKEDGAESFEGRAISRTGLQYSYKAFEDLGEWVEENGNWKYLKNEIPVTGWIEDKGDWYYLGADGYLAFEWVQRGRYWHFMLPNGKMAVNCWVWWDKYYYYFDREGRMMADTWIRPDGITWYFLNRDGIMLASWINVKGVWFYSDGYGRLQTNTITPDGYWVDENGMWDGKGPIEVPKK